MVLSLLVLVIVGIVAYFHFIQGFFSAALSAMLAIIAAVVAVGFHETVIVSLLGGRISELAHSLVLVALFALTYLILRAIFDAVVPGNVNVPLMVDKVGAGVMGVIAGIFAAGIFAIAAQALPFGPAVGQFARYDLAEDEAISFSLPGNPPQAFDAVITGALKDPKLDPNSRRGLLIPADNIVLGTAAHVSGTGALAGAVSLSDVHPNYLDELFYQKLGVQVGGKRVAINTASDQQVRVAGLFTIGTLQQVDSEHLKINYKSRWASPPGGSLASKDGNIIVIVRLTLATGAEDPDNHVRLSPASVRLVAGGQNHLPAGTLDHGTGPFLRVHRPDDFLLVPVGGTIDLVYYVAAESLGVSSDMRSTTPWSITKESFVEAKRLGMVPLMGMEIKRQDPGAPAQAQAMLRKVELPYPRGMAARPTAAPGAAPTAVAGSPVESVQAQVSSKFLAPVAVGRFEGNVENHTFPNGTAGIKDGKFSRIEINPGPAITALTGPEFVITDLWTPPGQKMVQVNAVVASGEGIEPWSWAAIGQFQLIDGDNNPRKPSGAWAKVKQGAVDTLVVRYNAEQPVAEIPRSDTRPTDICLLFLVPDGLALSELKFGTIRVASVNLQVP